MIVGAFFILLLTHSCREVTSWTMLTTVRPRSNSSRSNSSSSNGRGRGRQRTVFISSATIDNNDDDASISVEDDDNAPSFVSSDPKQQSPPLRPLYESEYTQVLSTTSLVPIATQLRVAYDQHFQDPRQPDAKRFAWDPWFVSAGDGRQQPQQQARSDEDDDDEKDDDADEPYQYQTVEGEGVGLRQQIQYSLKRIQTSQFFSDDDDDLYTTLVDDLVTLGTSIGLTAITPPWTSMYTDGDTQNFHTDAKHGPMAFVLSLAHAGDFRGGETMLLQPTLLDYWRKFETTTALECQQIVRYIPATTPFGRCLAFDPRVPHGVTPVIGSQDPRKARVVVHGWFNAPECCWFGTWREDNEDGDDDDDEDEAGESSRTTTLDAALEPLVATLGRGEIGRVMGYLAARLEVDADGTIAEVYAVCDTLQADPDDHRGVIGYDEDGQEILEDAAGDIRLTVYESLKTLQFETGAHGRACVVPFVFE